MPTFDCSEDGNEYEAEVKFIGESEGFEYATVVFTEYGNEETVWLKELKPIVKPNEPKADESKAAIPSPAPDGSWKVGDFCRAVYSEDGVEYEGKVTSSGESEGHQYFVVQVRRYVLCTYCWINVYMNFIY